MSIKTNKIIKVLNNINNNCIMGAIYYNKNNKDFIIKTIKYIEYFNY
jgi:hypothetical protein